MLYHHKNTSVFGVKHELWLPSSPQQSIQLIRWSNNNSQSRLFVTYCENMASTDWLTHTHLHYDFAKLIFPIFYKWRCSYEQAMVTQKRWQDKGGLIVIRKDGKSTKARPSEHHFALLMEINWILKMKAF